MLECQYDFNEKPLIFKIGLASGELALCARRVNPALDPGGSGKELVGEG